MISKSTHYAKQGEVQRNWVLVDADGAVLGRLATQIAMILRGKNKPQFTPNSDCGDFVVVINADKVQLTGNKADTKTYYRHSGYNGGLKAESFRQAMEKHPEKVIERAVRGMLPKTTLGRAQMTKLKVYAGAETNFSTRFEMSMLPESFFLMFRRCFSALSRLRLLMSTCSAILSASTRFSMK